MVSFVNNTVPELALGDNLYDDEVFTAGGANTYVAGTVLARLAADSKLVVYVSGGSGGEEIPKAILRNELITAGSGDTTIRAMLSGKVREDGITAYNSGTPLALTKLELDLLRDFTIVSQPDTELMVFDNST